MLSADTVLDEETLFRVLRLGHSRIPVHEAGNRRAIRGILLVKEMVLLDPAQKVGRLQPHNPTHTPIHLWLSCPRPVPRYI